MSKKKARPLIDENGEVRELTRADFREFRPAAEVLPADFLDAMDQRRKARGLQVAPTKQAISIRLSPEVIAHFKAGGKGWQSRIDEALREMIAR